jgi:hypothetical protein
MSSRRAWSNLSAQIAKMNEQDFRSFSLRLLRFWDIDIRPCHFHGMNYAVIRDTTVCSCAVLCLYFENKILGQQEASQAIKSIDRLSELDIKIEQYIIFHNQQHGDQEKSFYFQNTVRKKLIDLKDSSSINEFFILDRIDFVKKIQKNFKITIDNLLKQKSDLIRENINQRINRIQNIFEFGKYYINNVPFIEYIIQINSIGIPDIVKKNKSIDEDLISKQVWNLNTKERWALIHGEAGIGKTTTGASQLCKRLIMKGVH